MLTKILENEREQLCILQHSISSFFAVNILFWDRFIWTWKITTDTSPLYSASFIGNILQNYGKISQPGYSQWYSLLSFVRFPQVCVYYFYEMSSHV